ncbi:MAG: homoserine dehydrogenase [Anaerolineae bacterium]|nr:homoserine dehydrogenase [Anaerolineae bacterium]
MGREVRILLAGLGNLGRRFCDLLADKGALVDARYGLRLALVGAADSRGAAYDPGGLDPAAVSALKLAGETVGRLPGAGRVGWRAAELIAAAEADVLCEASPVNLEQGGEPGLTHVRTALARGMHVATPNKGPLVLAYGELHDLAARHGAQLRFDGTVAGGLPAINLGQRDLRGATVSRIEAVPNLCTGYVMDLLAAGLSWDAARERARAEGVLEGDGAFDLEGWDAAAKLVILVNAVMGVPARLEDVARTGISGLDGATLRAARAAGQVYKLVATAERRADGVGTVLRVVPTPLREGHFLANLGAKQMGVIYHTDIYGTLMAAIDEPTPVPSAATMLRDVLDIFV